jgi:hypothetical protein
MNQNDPPLPHAGIILLQSHILGVVEERVLDLLTHLVVQVEEKPFQFPPEGLALPRAPFGHQ